MTCSEFCTVQDVITLWRPLTTDEGAQASALIPIATDLLRAEAKRVGKDLDEMLCERPELRNVAKAAIVRAVSSAISSAGSSTGADVSQFTQSALGYSYTGTLANPGGGIWWKKSELKALGLLTQRYGVMEFYDVGGCHKCS